MADILLPAMPGGIIGNGSMLASIKENGELMRLFWPHIDAGQHMGFFYTGLKPEQGETIWLHTGAWQQQQKYEIDTNILVTRLTHPEAGLTVEQADFILPENDLLIRHYRVTSRENNLKKMALVNYMSLLIDESPLYDGMYFDFSHQALVQFRRDSFFALAAPGHRLLGYHCGRRDTNGDPLAPAGWGAFYGVSTNIRYSAGAVAWSLESMGQNGEASLFLAAGHSEKEVFSLLEKGQKTPGQKWRQKTAGYWRGWLPLDKGNSKGNSQDNSIEAQIYNRSLLVLKLLTNRNTGGIIAAPEFDPYYTGCGGYGYCWPRDGVYAAAALAEAGCLPEAKEFYYFASRLQNDDGSWQQRYFTNGQWAPTWGKQIDQVGSVLWGCKHYFTLTGAHDFIERIWSTIKRGAEYLIRNLSPLNHLPKPSMGVWEDMLSQSTYSAAATYAGLAAAAELAAQKGEETLAWEWLHAAEKVKQAIFAHLWNNERQCFLRGVSKQVSREEYEQFLFNGGQAWSSKDPSGLYDIYWIARDQRINAAALATIFPFRVLDPADPRAVSCLDNIHQTLGHCPAGGIQRYEGDTYAGGNPWILTSLWAAIVYARQGRMEQARSLYHWALANASPTGLLPEQVDKNKGGPAWVLPLSWSHAMFILCHLTMQGALKGL